jgi:hypothetical protein
MHDCEATKVDGVMPNFFRDPSVRSRLTSKQNAESFKPTMRYAPPGRTYERRLVRALDEEDVAYLICRCRACTTAKPPKKNLNARRRQSLSVDVGLGAEVREAAAGQQRRTITCGRAGHMSAASCALSTRKTSRT